MPVSRWTWRAMRSTTSSVTTCTDAARSISRCVSGVSGSRGRPAEELVERAVRHRQPVQVVEVPHVELEGAVVLSSTSWSRIRSA